MLESDFKVVTKPNCALTSTGQFRAFAVTAGFALLVASGFVVAGAWLVMPFAGLELLALGAAFYYVNGNAGDYEVLQISGDHLVVETCSRRRVERVEFNRYWVRVVLQVLPGGVRRLVLCSTGKQVGFGRFLSDDQRVALAKQLKGVTGLSY